MLRALSESSDILYTRSLSTGLSALMKTVVPERGMFGLLGEKPYVYQHIHTQLLAVPASRVERIRLNT